MSLNGEKNLSFVSLGCDKNRIDTEEILGLLNKKGFQVINDPSEAEVILVNTCAFIEDARVEAVDTLLEMAQYKNTGRCKFLVALGCMAQRYHRELQQEIPELDLVVGLNNYHQLPRLLAVAMKKGLKITAHRKPENRLRVLGERILTRPIHSVYVKISEGCDNLCNYCIIPRIRGPYRGRKISSIVNEVSGLVRCGAREVNLIAQDTTYYGIPSHGESCLPDLLESLARIEGLQWIRVLYAHPAHFSQRLLDALVSIPQVCSYLDLPLQHVSTSILKKMGRPYTKKDIYQIVEKLKESGITIRTTFITGFPGEKDNHFQELLTFMRNYQLDRVGIFSYSPEEGTPAYRLRGRVPADVVKKRQCKLMETQKSISHSLNLKEAGKLRPVLIEEKIFQKENRLYYYRGRTPFQAPEVDGFTFFTSSHEFQIGDMMDVMITDGAPYDLYGVPAV